MAAHPGGHSLFPEASSRASPPLRTLFPVVVVVLAAAVPLVLKWRERRRWANRTISGGRKALALYLNDRR